MKVPHEHGVGRIHEIDHVRDDLSITSIRGAAENDTSQFNVVVSVCQDQCTDNIGTHYVQFPLADDIHSEWEWGGSRSYESFSEAADFVLSRLAHADDYRVLVHCHSGQNRSVAVSIAALAVAEGLDYYEAGRRVNEARPVANVNQLMVAHAKRYIEEKT